MTVSRFVGLALRVALLVLVVGFVGAWLTGTLRFNLGVGNWNVQLNSAADASVPAKRSDPACLQAEAGMKMLAKPAVHAIRVRNPNTGKCTWEY